jgi:hypothetical protein
VVRLRFGNLLENSFGSFPQPRRDGPVEIRLDLGSVGGNGSDVGDVVAFFEGWDRVDVQDDTGDGSAGFEYDFAEIVGDKADFHALLNLTYAQKLTLSEVVG